MRETLERELKLSTGDGFVLPELGGTQLPRRVFNSTYHDTSDLALARNRVTLRYRSEDGTGVWQLKLPRGAARLELEHAGVPARPPVEVLALLVAYLRGREVGPVARLRTRREVVLADGAEVTEDFVSVFEGRRVIHRFRELEVELVSGDERALRRLEKALRLAGAGEADQRPKLFRALGLELPEDDVRIGPRTPPEEALGAALASQAQALLLHDPGTRLGTNAEDLHGMRVAIRRLRAFLRAARPLVEPSWSEPLRAELGWLGRALGPARDLDVLGERLAADVAGLEGGDREQGTRLVSNLVDERAGARHSVVEALSSDRYLTLLDRLEHVGSPELTGESRSLARLWRSEWKRTRKAIERLPRVPSEEALHDVRIRVKRVRYAAELASHELGKDGRRFVEAAQSLQDVLGDHQDASVAEERIRAWADEGAGGIAAGRLVEVEQQRKAEARAAWPSAWKKLRRAAKRLT